MLTRDLFTVADLLICHISLWFLKNEQNSIGATFLACPVY